MQKRLFSIVVLFILALLPARGWAITSACEWIFSAMPGKELYPCLVVNEPFFHQMTDDGSTALSQEWLSECSFEAVLAAIQENTFTCSLDASLPEHPNPTKLARANVVLFQPQHLPDITANLYGGPRQARSDVLDRVAEDGSTVTRVERPIDLTLRPAGQLTKDEIAESRSEALLEIAGALRPLSGEGQTIILSGAVPLFHPHHFSWGHAAKTKVNVNAGMEWVAPLLMGEAEPNADALTRSNWTSGEFARQTILPPQSIGDGPDGYKARMEIDLENSDDAAFVLKGTGTLVFRDMEIVLKRGALARIEGDVKIILSRSTIHFQRWEGPDFIVRDATTCSGENCRRRITDRIAFREELGTDLVEGTTTITTRGLPLLSAASPLEIRATDLAGLVLNDAGRHEVGSPFQSDATDDDLLCERMAEGWCRPHGVPAAVVLLARKKPARPYHEIAHPLGDHLPFRTTETSYFPTLDLIDELLEGPHLLIDDYGRRLRVVEAPCADGSLRREDERGIWRCPVAYTFAVDRRTKLVIDERALAFRKTLPLLEATTAEESGRMTIGRRYDLPTDDEDAPERGTRLDPDGGTPLVPTWESRTGSTEVDRPADAEESSSGGCSLAGAPAPNAGALPLLALLGLLLARRRQNA